MPDIADTMTIAELAERLAGIRDRIVAKGYSRYARPIIDINVWADRVAFAARISLGTYGNTLEPGEDVPRTACGMLAWLAEAEASLQTHINPADCAPWFTLDQSAA